MYYRSLEPPCCRYLLFLYALTSSKSIHYKIKGSNDVGLLTLLFFCSFSFVVNLLCWPIQWLWRTLHSTDCHQSWRHQSWRWWTTSKTPEPCGTMVCPLPTLFFSDYWVCRRQTTEKHTQPQFKSNTHFHKTKLILTQQQNWFGTHNEQTTGHRRTDIPDTWTSRITSELLHLTPEPRAPGVRWWSDVGVTGFFRSLSFTGTTTGQTPTGDATTIEISPSSGSINRNQSGDKLDGLGNNASSANLKVSS